MLTQRAALILRVHASLLFFLAVALIVRPSSLAEFMGFKALATTPELIWSFRSMGVLLLLPALLGPVVAAFAGERGLRQAAAGMAIISSCVGVVTLLAPIGISAGKILLSILWFLFALLYFYALRGRGRNR